jgi:hypothetical protein
MSRSGTSWRNEIFPVRSARIHSAARAIGPGDAPADNQQGDQNDEEDLSQHAEKSLAPDEKDFARDVAHVVHHRQAAQNFILAANRQGENMNRHASQPDERALFTILPDRLVTGGRTGREAFRQFRSHRYHCALPVVDGHA